MRGAHTQNLIVASLRGLDLGVEFEPSLEKDSSVNGKILYLDSAVTAMRY